MPDITSLQNPRVKYLVRLRDKKESRREDKLMLVEGWDEIQLALTSRSIPKTLIVAPDLTNRPVPGLKIDCEVLTVTQGIFEKISSRENPDGWLAIFPTPGISIQDLKLPVAPLLLITESIEKPGNLGGILRTADATGVDALLVSDPRVDLYNPNVVRASRGTIFTVPTIEVSNAEAFSLIRQHNIKIVAATSSADDIYSDVDLIGSLAVVVGSEDRGLTDFWLTQADLRVKIPMRGMVNSLNVSVATALILYEVLRQRQLSKT